MINAEMNGFILVSDAGDEERSTFELCNERYIHIIWIVLNGLILLTIIALYSLARWRNKNPKDEYKILESESKKRRKTGSSLDEFAEFQAVPIEDSSIISSGKAGSQRTTTSKGTGKFPNLTDKEDSAIFEQPAEEYKRELLTDN